MTVCGGPRCWLMWRCLMRWQQQLLRSYCSVRGTAVGSGRALTCRRRRPRTWQVHWCAIQQSVIINILRTSTVLQACCWSQVRHNKPTLNNQQSQRPRKCPYASHGPLPHPLQPGLMLSNFGPAPCFTLLPPPPLLLHHTGQHQAAKRHLPAASPSFPPPAPATASPGAECIVLDQLNGVGEPDRHAGQHQAAQCHLPRYPEQRHA